VKLFPIEGVGELSVLDLWFHLHFSADARSVWPST
jgi:hypothetical protein